MRSLLIWAMVMMACPVFAQTRPAIDLPYKPGPLTEPEEPVKKPKVSRPKPDPVKAAVPMTVVDVAIPYIASKSPEPVGAPDPP